MKKWVLSIVMGVFCVGLIAFLPQIPGCVMANLPKTGRVVDGATGEGLSGVAVIASALFATQMPLGGGAFDYPYRVLVRTDSNGYFRIPSNWHHLRMSLPGLEARETWFVTAFKPGYVVAQDLEYLSKFDPNGRAIYRPWSTTTSPPADWRFFYVAVEPLRMQRATLKLDDAASYYRDIIGAGTYVEDTTGADEVALRREAFELLAPQICGLPDDATVSSDVGGAFETFVSDRTKFIDSLRDLEPSGFADTYTHPVFHAGIICQAMKASNI